MAREQKSIKKNTIYNMLKTFSSIIFPLITFPYVSRVLSPVGIGKYNFSNTYVGYFSLIASLGITTYAIRECAAVRDDQEKLDKVSSQIFSINICTMLIAYVALFISLVFFRKLDSYRNLIIIFSSNILFTIVGADWINSAFEDFRYITLRTFGMQLISLICIFIFVRKPSDVMNYALITVLASGGANILNMFYRRRFCRMRFIKDMEWKRHIPGIVMLFVMILAQSLYSSTDITMLGLMKDDYIVGLYSTSVKIFNILNQVISSILWVLLPRLSSYYATNDEENINRLLRKAFAFMMTVGMPCVVGCIMAAKPIIYIVGGNEYMGAVPYLRMSMIASLFSMLGGAFLGNIVFISSRKEKYFMYACIIAACVNVGLNFVLIPEYEAYAAAFTTILSEIVITIYLFLHLDDRKAFICLLKLAIQPAIGCIFLALICLFTARMISNMMLQFCVEVVLGAGVYFMSLYLMKYPIVDEVIGSIRRKIKG
jgi:O-antigen/teichoic acid export membrane protein